MIHSTPFSPDRCLYQETRIHRLTSPSILMSTWKGCREGIRQHKVSYTITGWCDCSATGCFLANTNDQRESIEQLTAPDNSTTRRRIRQPTPESPKQARRSGQPVERIPSRSAALNRSPNAVFDMPLERQWRRLCLTCTWAWRNVEHGVERGHCCRALGQEVELFRQHGTCQSGVPGCSAR